MLSIHCICSNTKIKSIHAYVPPIPIFSIPKSIKDRQRKGCGSVEVVSI